MSFSLRPLSALIVPALAVLAAGAQAAAPAAADFPVIAYFPNWVGYPTSTNVEFERLTHVNYSFVLPTSGGGVQAPNDGMLKELVRLAHARNVKVGVAIGGWNDGNTKPFDDMASNPAFRATFVKNVMAMVDKYALDGIDIDWEYPRAHSVTWYTALMKELSAALKPKGKFLSTAVISSGNSVGQYVTNEVFDVLDYLNIMAYDAGGANHTSYTVATTALDYWVTQRKCPKEKAILGLGFYGRDANGGSYTDYKVIVGRDPQAHTKDQSGNLGYNGVPTIERKVDLAAQRAGGVMIWEISQDTHDDRTSLLRAIDRKVKAMPGPVSLRGPGAAGLSAGAAIGFSAPPGLLRVTGAPAGAYILRLRTPEGRQALARGLTADRNGSATLRRDALGLERGLYFATLEREGSVLQGAVLPIPR